MASRCVVQGISVVATWNSRSRNCGPEASSPACWNAGGASTRLSTWSSWRHTSTASPPAPSTTWSKPSARTPGYPRARSPGSARTSTDNWRPSAPARWTTSASPCLFLDATYVKARVDHRIVSQAIVIATGVTQDGGREVVGVMVGDGETGRSNAAPTSSRSSPTRPPPSASPSRTSPNSTTNGPPSPAATPPTRAWTASAPTPRQSCPARRTTDRLHHEKGHDRWSAIDMMGGGKSQASREE